MKKEIINSFDKIVGKTDLIDRLKCIVNSQSRSHAYLFLGSSGCGKYTISSVFAKGLLCMTHGKEPCGFCRSCVLFDAGNNPDIVLVEPEDKSIKNNQIQDMIVDINRKPTISTKKVYLIKNAGAMTVQAQNTLLKTLEEPPETAVIILMADNTSNLLDTVLSRCQVIRIGSYNINDILVILKRNTTLEDERLAAYAKLSNGIPGKAIELANSELFRDLRECVFELLPKLCKAKPYDRLMHAEFFYSKKDNVDQIFDIMILFLRDVIMYILTGSRKLLANIDKFNIIEKWAEDFTIEYINNIIECANEARYKIHSNANYQLTIENMLLSF